MGSSLLSPTGRLRAIVVGCGALMLAGFIAGTPAPGVAALVMLVYLVHTRVAASAALRASVITLTRRVREAALYEGEVFRVLVDARPSKLSQGVQMQLWDVIPGRVEVAQQPALNGPGRMVYDARAPQKGQVSFRAFRVDLTDARGLWRTTRLHRCETHLRVLSSIDYVKQRVRATHDSNEGSVPAPLSRLVKELEFETIRPFASGDRLRDMDWKRTAKYSDLMTKQWEKQDDSSILFLIDASRTMRARHEGPSKLERALQWTLELAESAQYQNQVVGHLIFDEVGLVDELAPARDRQVTRRMAARFSDIPTDIQASRRLDVASPQDAPPDQEERAFLDQLEQLRGISATKRGQRTGAGIQRAVDRLISSNRTQSMQIICFTDLEGFPDASIQALSQVVRQGNSAFVAVLPGTRFLAPPEKPSLRDLENAYREREARSHCREQLQARGIRLLELSPEDAALRVLKGSASRSGR